MKFDFEFYWDTYQGWLCNLADIDNVHTYSILADILHSTPFRAVIKMDRNRISDAIHLRQRFCREQNVIFDVPDNEICDGSCSILELLVSFALRIDQEYTGNSSEDHPEILFAHFIQNLGLSEFTDESFYWSSSNWEEPKSRLMKILDDWMDGDISERGVGGLFPLIYHPGVIQRGKELWSQMQPYIAENFFGRRK